MVGDTLWKFEQQLMGGQLTFKLYVRNMAKHTGIKVHHRGRFSLVDME
jgi:hypothetical protein